MLNNKEKSLKENEQIEFNKKEKILFIYPRFSSFVRADYEILSEKYNIAKHQYVHKKQIMAHVLAQIKLKFWLFKNIFNAKAVYVWFADYHSFLPILFAKIFNKKSFLILGGYDVTYIASLDYGSLNNPIRAFCTRQSIQNATVNLAVSKYVFNQAKVIDPNANIEIIYNGINLSVFNFGVGNRKNRVLTVGVIDSVRRIRLKGIDVFIKVAKALPEYEFVIVGITKNMQQKLGEIPGNLEMIEQVPHDELQSYYNSSKIYCQFSIVESFCLALAEAMACGCTGVVANVGALPEVVGKSGFIVNTESIKDIIGEIEEAIAISKKGNLESVKMIEDNFNIDDRKKKIFENFNKYGLNSDE